MKDFIAIDVETANAEPSSICAIGAVKVVEGIIVDSRYTTVNPEPDYYLARNTAVHGLSDRDTCDSPVFGNVWEAWSDWLEGFTLVAHNARFDAGCIRAACRVYGLEPPERWECTLVAARRKIPRGMLQSKSLDSLSDFFGIPLHNHHNALDDAMACAKLAIILND